MPKKTSPSNQKEPKQYNAFIKYSGLAVQMGATIYLGNLLGKYLDGYFNRTDELLSKAVTFAAVILAIASTIRQVTKDNSD